MFIFAGLARVFQTEEGRRLTIGRDAAENHFILIRTDDLGFVFEDRVFVLLLHIGICINLNWNSKSKSNQN